MKKLYSYCESFRGGRVEGYFTCTEDELKTLFGEDLYYGECLGKHSELSFRFDSEEDFTVVSEDQDFIEKFESLIGYMGYNPFDYLPEYEDDFEDEE